MTKKPKTAMQKTKEYLSDRKYQLTNMHEDVVEDLDETKGPGYVWISIEVNAPRPKGGILFYLG